MRTTPSRLAGSLVVAGALTTLLAAPAAAQCDPYSGGCGGGGTGTTGTTTGTTGGGGGGTGVTTPRQELPFTGGEVLLVSLVGASALAGGTVLLVAGRRRRPTALPA